MPINAHPLILYLPKERRNQHELALTRQRATSYFANSGGKGGRRSLRNRLGGARVGARTPYGCTTRNALWALVNFHREKKKTRWTGDPRSARSLLAPRAPRPIRLRYWTNGRSLNPRLLRHVEVSRCNRRRGWPMPIRGASESLPAGSSLLAGFSGPFFLIALF